MATKLHRCGNHARFGPCWRVRKALDTAGNHIRGGDGAVAPEEQGRRDWGHRYREESREMARTISEGRLMEKQRGIAANR